jgi:hypothetical protein
VPSQQRLLTSLLKLLPVEEVATDTLILSWRHNEQGQYYALQLTAAGSIAVGNTGEPVSVEPVIHPAAEAAMLATQTETAPDDSAEALGPGAAATGGKLGKIQVVMGGEDGATLDELVTLTS